MRDGVLVPAVAHVKGSCVGKSTFFIKDRGAVGRGKKIFTVRKGLLAKHGYGTHLSEVTRHEALRKAVRAYGATSVFRKLNAQVVFRKREDGVKQVFVADRDWVRSNFMGG